MKRSLYSLCVSLIVLVKPLYLPMFFAILLGLSGHLAATFISISGASILLNLTPLSTSLTLVFMGACALLRGPFRYIEQACNHYIAFRLLALLRDQIFGKLRTLAPAKLEGKDKGNLISIITSDIELLEVFYAHTISPVLIAMFQSLIMTLLLIQIHPILGLAACFFYVLHGAVLPAIISKRNKNSGLQMRNASGDLSSFVLETLHNMEDLIQYNQTDAILKQLEEKNKQLDLHEKKQKTLLSQNNAFSQGIMLSGNLTIFAIAMILASNRLISYREAVLAMIMLSSSYGPTAALAALGSTLQNTFAAAERVLNLLDEAPVTEPVSSDVSPSFEQASMHNVSFSYDNQPVLNQMSFGIRKGQLIGISGKSGSGKSTLLRLLMRFWEIDEGSLTISGHDINTIDSKALSSMQSLMVQDTWLFHDTIEENLRIAKHDATQNELEEACRKAALHDFIMTLPSGYKTKLSELGSSISGGERQRLGLARIFLKEADLILLDEPTSNLDSLNEAIILKALKEHQKDKTMILVSHRPQTLRIADQMIHLNEGASS